MRPSEMAVLLPRLPIADDLTRNHELDGRERDHVSRPFALVDARDARLDYQFDRDDSQRWVFPLGRDDLLVQAARQRRDDRRFLDGPLYPVDQQSLVYLPLADFPRRGVRQATCLDGKMSLEGNLLQHFQP